MVQSCVSEKLYRRRKLLKRGMWIASIPKFLDSYEEKKMIRNSRFQVGRMYHSTVEEFLAKICTVRNFYCFSVSITIPRRSRVSERRRDVATR